MATSDGSNMKRDMIFSSNGMQCCELCGVSGLTDEQLRNHLQLEHVQDCAVCPFCDMIDLSAEVMMVHVNEAHLDYLSPQSEILDDSELYEDCIDSSSPGLSHARHPDATAGKMEENEESNTTSYGDERAVQQQTQVTAGGGAVSKRSTAVVERSNSALHKSKTRSSKVQQSDVARDVAHRMTRSASNSPAYSRRTPVNLNEASGAPIITFDDNCNLHVSGSSDCGSTHSSPSRSHLSLNLTSKSSPKNSPKHNTTTTSNSNNDKVLSTCTSGLSNDASTNDSGKRVRSDSRREAFANQRSNSTPVATTSNPEKRPMVEVEAENVTFMDVVVTKCPICGQEEDSPHKLERHINQIHFDSTSPSVLMDTGAVAPSSTGVQCPICCAAFETGQDVELHVNVTHMDILSPNVGAAAGGGVAGGESISTRGGSASSDGSSNNTVSSEDDNNSCPVCGTKGFSNNPALALHIETHFNRKPSAAASPDAAVGEVLQEKKAKDLQKMRENQEFSQLQAQYGMDGRGNFKQQYVTNMQRAVYSGKMSITDYYETEIKLNKAERTGLDDGSTRTKGLLNGLLHLSLRCREVKQVYLCSAVDHYSSTYGDKGWGCGYRNIQMMLSSLQHHTGYYERLFAAPDAILSIAALQSTLEKAWGAGFDPQGCEQLGGKLSNTRKWIGATELTTLLSFSRIRCELLDFHHPTAYDGTHPEMFAWCRRYFSSDRDFKPPLYLQHQGHSRTVIGCEVLHGNPRTGSDETIQLLVLDPSHSSAQIRKLLPSWQDSNQSHFQQQNNSSSVQQPLNISNENSSGDNNAGGGATGRRLDQQNYSWGNNTNNSSSSGGGGGGCNTGRKTAPLEVSNSANVSAGKKVGYTLSGATVVVSDDEFSYRGRGRGGDRGSRGRGGERGNKDNNYNSGNNNRNNGGNNNSSMGALRMLRRPLRTMKAMQYQLVAVVDVMDSEEQYQRSKILRSTRIPKT